MAHVADVDRSIEFYSKLGFRVVNTLKDEAGKSFFAGLTPAPAGWAVLMLTRAGDPVIASQQAILFYLYTDDIRGLRALWEQRGIEVSPITHPFYMEKGEMRVHDPDGYCLLVGQTE